MIWEKRGEMIGEINEKAFYKKKKTWENVYKFYGKKRIHRSFMKKEEKNMFTCNLILLEIKTFLTNEESCALGLRIKPISQKPPIRNHRSYRHNLCCTARLDRVSRHFATQSPHFRAEFVVANFDDWRCRSTRPPRQMIIM